MSVHGSLTDNPDKSQSLSMGITKDTGSHVASGNVFMDNYRDKNPVTSQPIAPTYSAVGANLGIANSAGNAASISAQHMPKIGDQLRVDMNTNLSKGPNHSVDVNTFAARNMPVNGPSFNSHGAGVNAQLGKFGANASVAHTPMFKATEYSVGGHVNLHQSPTGSATFGVGATRMDAPFSRGNWQPGMIFKLDKRF